MKQFSNIGGFLPYKCVIPIKRNKTCLAVNQEPTPLTSTLSQCMKILIYSKRLPLLPPPPPFSPSAARENQARLQEMNSFTSCVPGGTRKVNVRIRSCQHQGFSLYATSGFSQQSTTTEFPESIKRKSERMIVSIHSAETVLVCFVTADELQDQIQDAETKGKPGNFISFPLDGEQAL